MENESNPSGRDVGLALVGFVGFPIAYICYNVLMHSFWWGRPLEFYAIDVSMVQLLMALLALGEIGVLLAIGHKFRIRIGRWWALFVLTLVPFAVSGGILPGKAKSETGYTLFLFALIGIVVATEAVTGQFDLAAISSRTRRWMLVLGTGHAIGGVLLQLVARSSDVFVDGLFTFTIPVILSTGVFFMLTAAAVVAWKEQGLWAPLAVHLLWYLWGLSGVISTPGTTSAGQFQGVDYSAAGPHVDYLLSWPKLLLLSGLVLVIEWGVRASYRSVRDGQSGPFSSPSK